MSARGEQTREHLLDVAEMLLGERGVSGVSLREIRLAAGSRNTAAMQFHFGDRDGLLEALISRHMPRIAEIQQALAESTLLSDGPDEPRALVEVLVRPSAEYLRRGPSERAWVKIMADLAALPDLYLGEMVFVTPDAGVRAGRALFQALERTLPPVLARERVMRMVQTAVHLCANYARLVDNPDRDGDRVAPEVFIENLVDMVHGALFTPMSPATEQVLFETGTRRRRRSRTR